MTDTNYSMSATKPWGRKGITRLVIHNHERGLLKMSPDMELPYVDYDLRFFDSNNKLLSVSYSASSADGWAIRATAPNQIAYIDCCKDKRPPIGLRPRFIVEEKRCAEIQQAIGRYNHFGKDVPLEWLEELAERKAWLQEYENAKSE